MEKEKINDTQSGLGYLLRIGATDLCNNDCILSGDITKPNMFQCISHQIILKHIHKRVKEVIETKRTINNYMMRIIKRYSR